MSLQRLFKKDNRNGGKLTTNGTFFISARFAIYQDVQLALTLTSNVRFKGLHDRNLWIKKYNSVNKT